MTPKKVAIQSVSETDTSSSASNDPSFLREGAGGSLSGVVLDRYMRHCERSLLNAKTGVPCAMFEIDGTCIQYHVSFAMKPKYVTFFGGTYNEVSIQAKAIRFEQGITVDWDKILEMFSKALFTFFKNSPEKAQTALADLKQSDPNQFVTITNTTKDGENKRLLRFKSVGAAFDFLLYGSYSKAANTVMDQSAGDITEYKSFPLPKILLE